jgi:hypothetical protein
MAVAAQVLVRIAAQAKDFNRTIKQVEKRVERMEKRLESLQTTSQRTGRRMVASFAAVAPALVPIGGAAVAVAGALASSFGAAGVAVAGAGAVAVGVLKDVFEVSEDIQKINEKIEKAQATGASQKQINKLMKERAHIMRELSKEQQRAATALADFKSFWEDFTKSFEKPVIDMFVVSLDVLRKTLEGMRPAINAAMGAIAQLMNGLSRALDTVEFQAFFQWLAREAGPSVMAFGQTTGNIFRGIMHLFMAFEPLTHSVRAGMVGVSQSFADWARSLKGSEGFKAFLGYVQENGPKVVNILKNIGILGGDIVKAFAPLGSAILTALDQAIEGLANNVGPLLQKIAEGFRKGDPQIIGNAFVDIINKGVVALQGKMAQIDWGRVAQAIGTGIGMIGQFAGVIVPRLVQAFTTIFNQIPWSQIATAIAAQAGKIAPQMAAALVAIINAMISILPAIMPAIIRFAYEFAIAFTKALFNPSTWKPLWEQYGWGLIVQLIMLIFAPAKVVGLLGQVLSRIPIVGKLLSWLVTSLNSLGGPARGKFKEKFNEILQGVLDGAKQKWPQIKTWLQTQATNLANWLKDKASEKFKNASKKWMDKVIEGLKNLPSRLYQSGRNAVSEFVSGLLSKVKAVESAARKLANKVKNFIGFSSPTKEGPGRLADRWAPNFVNMFAKGLEKGVPKIERAMNSMALTGESAFSKPVNNAPSTNKTYNITINNHGSGDTTGQSTIAALRRWEWLDA